MDRDGESSLAPSPSMTTTAVETIVPAPADPEPGAEAAAETAEQTTAPSSGAAPDAPGPRLSTAAAKPATASDRDERPSQDPAQIREEHQLLRSARAALADNPRRAYGLTQEHKRRFPSGMLAQEREVIAIEALSRMGRSDAASSRADQFSDEYPDSPHRIRVDRAASGKGGARP
jgi:hypothetical protein